jgi:DNA invertase Pin-like site-specific DNA recombinase
MIYGYARVSTFDQKLNLQNDALRKFGCERVFEEKISGANKDRPGLNELLFHLRAGDTLVVWKLDRLGRSLKNLVELLEVFKERDIKFVSITDSIDTGTATGRFTFNILASLAQLEREMISDRTKAGLSSARLRGKKGGRPPGLSKEKIKIAQQVKKLFDLGDDIEDIKLSFKISQATIYRYVAFIKARDEQKSKS